MIILHILLYSAIILLHFLLYFPIRTSGGAKKKMENSKSYYFRILLELAFLKGAKMAAELFKSRSYSIVFQKMTQIWNSCASLGMDLSVEHKASTWHLVYQQFSKAQVDNFLIRRIPCHCDINSFYLIILPQYSATYTTPHITCTVLNEMYWYR